MEKTLTVGQVGDIMSLLYGAQYDDLDEIRGQLRDILDNDEELINILDDHLVSIAEAHYSCDYCDPMEVAFGPDWHKRN